MKTNKFLAVMLLAALFVGCSKDNDSSAPATKRINIFANNMGGNGSKIHIDPTNVSSINSSAAWIPGERIDLNGAPYAIENSDNAYYLSVPTPAPENLYAVYPGTTNTAGNHVDVVNTSASGATITLHSLAVNFHDSGHDIILPMAAKANDNSSGLYFDHITAAFRLQLHATSATTENLKTLKVIVYGSAAAAPVVVGGIDYTTKWASQGPTMPSGNIGTISGDYDVRYASEMIFDMQNNGSSTGVGFNTDETKTFCVPVTVADVKRLTIIGVDVNGNKIFDVTHLFNSAVTAANNNIYTIPVININ